MYKQALVLLALIFFSQFGLAQTREAEAKVFFSKAEEHFNNGELKATLENLDAAVQTLGNTNPRILYLRIQALNALSNTSWSYVAPLDSALDAFFVITDQSKYPKEKYDEIASISVDHKLKKKQYEQDFERLQHSDSLTLFEDFEKKYPNSPHLTSILPKYNELLERDKQRKEQRQAALAEAAASKFRKQFRGFSLGFWANGGFTNAEIDGMSDMTIDGELSGLVSYSGGITLGYMFNKHFGIFSGVGVTKVGWSDAGDNSINNMYLSIPVYFQAISSTKRKAGVYLQAGAIYNTFLTQQTTLDLEESYADEAIFHPIVSAGLSLRNQRAAWLLGPFVKFPSSINVLDLYNIKVGVIGFQVSLTNVYK